METFLPRSSDHGCSQEIIARWFKRGQEEQNFRPKDRRSQECQQEIVGSTGRRSKTVGHASQELECKAIDSLTHTYYRTQSRFVAQELSVITQDRWRRT